MNTSIVSPFTDTRRFSFGDVSKTSRGLWVRTAPAPITLAQADALEAINRKYDGFDGFTLEALEASEVTATVRRVEREALEARQIAAFGRVLS